MILQLCYKMTFGLRNHAFFFFFSCAHGALRCEANSNVCQHLEDLVAGSERAVELIFSMRPVREGPVVPTSTVTLADRIAEDVMRAKTKKVAEGKLQIPKVVSLDSSLKHHSSSSGSSSSSSGSGASKRWEFRKAFSAVEIYSNFPPSHSERRKKVEIAVPRSASRNWL